MKKIVALLLVFAGVVGVQPPLHAADIAPSIAVIDTGTDPALFPGKIVAEACFLEYYTCANGQPTMEGAGASYIAPTTNKDFCLLYTSPSPRDRTRSRMPSSA